MTRFRPVRPTRIVGCINRPMANTPIFFRCFGTPRGSDQDSCLDQWASPCSVISVGFAASLALAPPVAGLEPARTCRRGYPANLVKRALETRPAGARRAACHRGAQSGGWKEIARLHRNQSALPSRALPAILKPQSGRPLAIGFLYQLARQGRSQLAVPEAIAEKSGLGGSQLDGAGRSRASSSKTRLDRRALDFIRATKPSVAILPMIQNATLRANGMDPVSARLLADRAPQRPACSDQIVKFVADNKLQGVTVDFEDVPPGAHKDLEDFLTRMSAAFAPHDWIIAQAAPFDDDQWPYIRPMPTSSITRC